jgi:hypothetical protein
VVLATDRPPVMTVDWKYIMASSHFSIAQATKRWCWGMIPSQGCFLPPYSPAWPYQEALMVPAHEIFSVIISNSLDVPQLLHYIKEKKS